MVRKTFVFAAVFVLALSVVASADWDVDDPAKWVQLPDINPTGFDVNATTPYILADDFLCTETGPIENIHIWGSWRNDYFPFGEDYNAVTFTLSIHADIPASQSPTGYSMPGELLWMIEVDQGEFEARIWDEGLEEGWLDPPDDYIPFGDSICVQYNFQFIGDLAFVQTGTESEPIVYWLDVQAHPHDQDAYFGWKCSFEHWNDNAVWVQGMEPWVGDWYELIYPPGHPWYQGQVDLAFVIAGPEDPPELDWGDAPDPTYPTYSASGGAYHLIVPGYQMGALVDSESDGQPDPSALGDDMGGLPDEDGLAFTTGFAPGAMAGVGIDMTASASGGYINAWIDFGQDGSWAEATDQVLSGIWVPGGAITTLNFNVPTTAVPGMTIGRFRMSTNAGLTFTGGAPNGEVEDHEIFIQGEQWKWDQYPDLGETGIDIRATADHILADDFLCTEPGRLTHIDVWGSWMDDYLPFVGQPSAVKFTLSIHEDIPADESPTGYSMPGELLWFRDFQEGEFEVDIWADQLLEGWMNPPEEYWFPGDTICWRYSFFMDPLDAFHQVGMPDSGVVYWLDVQATPEDPAAVWGWKTSLDHWNDDAVWGYGVEPYPGPWYELIYPPNHTMTGQSIDLAFALEMFYGTGVPDEAPMGAGLRQNVPNPFNPKTEILYQVPAGGGHVTIEIYDVAGRLVNTLVDEVKAEGERTVAWDGTDEAGQQMATGVYFYRMVAGEVESSRKMLLLK